MKEVAVLVLASNDGLAFAFAKRLQVTMQVTVQADDLRSEGGLKVNAIAASVRQLGEALSSENAELNLGFQQATYRIMSALDQEAEDLLRKLEQTIQSDQFAGRQPVFCWLDEAIAEHCHSLGIQRLWVHCPTVDDSRINVMRQLSKSGIMPVGATSAVDRTVRAAIIEAATAYCVDAPCKQEKLDILSQALEFYTQQMGVQGILVDHHLQSMLDYIPMYTGVPYYLLGRTDIYANKLAKLALSYC